jgi:hypothetical protein
MNDIQVLDRPASQSFYAVAGRLLFIQSLDHSLATLIERLFAGWQLTPVSFPERNPDISITFSCGASLPDAPLGLSEFEVAAGGRCYTAANEYYLKFDNSLLHLRGDEDPLSVSVWIKRISGAMNAELARVTSFAVCAALRRFGLFELHSAGVIVPNSKTGVLIVGPSGSGKSTLTLQLATSGWGYLSDDELLLSIVDGEVEARGFRSFFALAATVTGKTASALKACFEPSAVFATPAESRTVPQFVLFTSISGASRTKLRELTQAETMMRLIKGCPWATYDTAIAAPNLDLLSRLARHATGFDLMAGADLLQPGQASEIIGAVCH